MTDKIIIIIITNNILTNNYFYHILLMINSIKQQKKNCPLKMINIKSNHQRLIIINKPHGYCLHYYLSMDYCNVI